MHPAFEAVPVVLGQGVRTVAPHHPEVDLGAPGAVGLHPDHGRARRCRVALPHRRASPVEEPGVRQRQQRLRPSAEGEHGRGVAQRDPGVVALAGRLHGEDLHRRVGLAQTCVGGDVLGDVRHQDRAEERHPRQAGRLREGLVDDDRPRRCGAHGLEIVAHDEVRHACAAQSLGEPRPAATVLEAGLDGVEKADVPRARDRDTVTDPPRRGRQRLHGLVLRPAPPEGAEGGGRYHQGAPRRGGQAQPVGGLTPVGRQLGVGPAARDGAGPRGCGRGRDGGDDQADGDEGGALRHQPEPHAALGLAPCGPGLQGRHRPCHSDRERQRDQGLGLVDVAQGCQRPVEQVAERLGTDAVDVADMPETHEDDAGEEHEHEEPALADPGQGQPGQADGGHGRRAQHGDRRRHEGPPGLPERSRTICEVGDPVGHPPQDRVGIGHRGGDRRRLDPVEERRRVAAQQQQRQHEPG